MFSHFKIHALAFFAAFVGIFVPVVVYAGSFFNILSIAFAVVAISVVSFGSLTAPTIGAVGGLVGSAGLVTAGGALTALGTVSVATNLVSIGVSAAGLAGGDGGPDFSPESASAIETSAKDGGPGGIRYATPGEYTLEVRADQTELVLESWGAGGGGRYYDSLCVGHCGLGGNGGYAKATIPVTPGETLSIIVGSGGSPSGHGVGLYGWGGGPFGGGGLSGVFRGIINHNNLSNNEHLIIAAGGGGGSNWYGGHGGGLNGQDAPGGFDHWYRKQVHWPGAKGGTQTSGGIGARGYGGGYAGSLYKGGTGSAGGPGGGGGYYGGGGGSNSRDDDGRLSPGGAGGSSYVPAGGETVYGGGASGASALGRSDTAGSKFGADGIVVVHWAVVDEAPLYCTDGIDNDQDGLIDSADPDCSGSATQCANDCSAGPQCALLSICGGGETSTFQASGTGQVGTTQGGTLTTNVNQCVDGIDNDQDGVFDCNDSECSAEPICNQPNFALFSSNNIFLTFLGQEAREESTFTNISVAAENNFNEDISCGIREVIVEESEEEVTSAPEGIIAQFTDPVLSASEYETGTLFNVSLPTEVSAGTYTIIVECEGGGLTRSVSVGLNVESVNPVFQEF